MSRRKLKILVMMHEELLPPKSLDGLSRKDIDPIKTEFHVVTALGELGHEVHQIGLHDELAPLRDKLTEVKPDIVFNLLEGFHGLPVFDQHVVSYLELKKQRYTGCNPRGLTLGRDKGLSKKVLHYHRIRIPAFAVFPFRAKPRGRRKLEFPVIVKALSEEGSTGIAEASVVNTEDKLEKRVQFVHENFGTDAIVEEYIDGREVYSAVMGNARLRVFPTWELLITKLRDDAPSIATASVKWDLDYQKRRGVQLCQAEGLTDEQQAMIARTTKRVFRALGMTGYARVDFRLDKQGRLYFIEANPNPDIAQREEFASAAKAAGIEYNALIQRILQLGLKAPRPVEL